MKISKNIRPTGWLISEVLPVKLMTTIVIAQTIDRKPSELKNRPANNNNNRVNIRVVNSILNQPTWAQAHPSGAKCHVAILMIT